MKISYCLLIGVLCCAPAQSVFKFKKIAEHLHKIYKNHKRNFWYNENIGVSQKSTKFGEYYHKCKKEFPQNELLLAVLGVVTSVYCGQEDGDKKEMLGSDMELIRVISCLCLFQNPLINGCAYFYGYNEGKKFRDLKDAVLKLPKSLTNK